MDGEGAKILDFWKDVCTTRCARCGKQRGGPGSRQRWRGNYCSEVCKERVRKAFRELWLTDRSNVTRPGNHKPWQWVFRAIWIPREASLPAILFDFAEERILDDGWYGDPPNRRNYSREPGHWQPVKCRDGLKCDGCGETAGFFTPWISWKGRGRTLWCSKCWCGFCWVPRRRLARFLPHVRPIASDRPSPYDAATLRGFSIINGGRAARPVAV